MDFAPLLAQAISYPRDMANAMITACCVAAFGIAFAYTFANLSHIFTAIADNTAGGRDEVGWSSEPMIDRLTKAAWLAWAILVSLAPSFVISRLLPSSISNWVFLGVFGLVFPVVYLSLQTGQSPGSILHPDVVTRISKRPDYLLAFVTCSFIVTLGIGLGIRFSILSPAWCVPFGSAILAGSLMIWARLIGRLAHLVSRVRTRVRARKNAQPRGPTPRRSPPVVARAEPVAADDEATYGLRSNHAPEPEADVPTPSLKRVWVEEGADDPYAFADGATDPEPRLPLPDAIAKPSEYEVSLAVGSRPTPPPPLPWVNGTFSFPFRPNNWPAWVTLTLCLVICALLGRVIISG